MIAAVISTSINNTIFRSLYGIGPQLTPAMRKSGRGI